MIGDTVKVDRWDLAAIFGLVAFLAGVALWLGWPALVTIGGLTTLAGGIVGGMRTGTDGES